jgi:hypothetical protein
MLDYFEIEMPVGAEILCVQVQYGTAKIWALVDDPTITEKRKFRIKVTGEEFNRFDLKYIGTVQLHDGHFVGHLFEIN